MASSETGGVSPPQQPAEEDDYTHFEDKDDSTIQSLIQEGQVKITVEAISSDGKNNRKASEILTQEYMHEDGKRHFCLELLAVVSPVIMQDCMNRSTTEVRLNDSDVELDTEQLSDYAISDNRYLGRALWSLVKGEVPDDKPCTREHINKVKADASMFANMMCVFIATEMLIRMFRKGPGILQLVLGQLMTTMKVPTKFKEFMTRIRLSASRTKMDKTSEKTVLQKLKNGVTIGTGALFGWFADNIGFKHYGAVLRSGYSSHIIMQLLCVPAKVLETMKLYGPHSLSRTRSNWDDVKQDLEPSDFLPSDHDYDVFGLRWLSMIDLALIATPKAPTVEEARSRLKDATFYCDERNPDDIGIHCQDVLEGMNMETMATSMQAAAADDMGEEDADNMYEKNYITTDNPIDNNLAKKDVVRNLMDGAQRVYEDHVGKDKTDWDAGEFAGETPIAEDFGTFFATDGDPAIQGLRILQDNDSYSVIFKAGGFHYMLKAYNGCGHTFGPTSFGWTVQRYRKTEKQKEWMLFPSDPNQTEEELPEIVLANLVTLNREYETRTGIDDASAEVIHDFFVKASKEEKRVFAVLMHMLWTNVIFMVRDSESDGDKGNAELFFSALRFMLLFSTVNNNTGYVELGLDWEKWRRTASDADMKVYKELIFTKLTVNGKSIFGDRFVEWSVRDHRKPMGKFFRVGHVKLLRRMSLTMTNALKALNPMKGVKPDPEQKSEDAVEDDSVGRSVEFGYVFCKTLVALHDSNYFGEGPVLKGGQELPEGSTADGKGIISDNWLNLLSTAESRTLAVVSEKCFGGPAMAGNAKTRFARPPCFVADEKENAATIRLCITTLDTGVLTTEKYSTGAFLEAEYKWLKAQVGNETDFPSRQGSNKAEKAASVIAARRLLLTKDGNALEQRASAVIGESPNGESDLDTKKFYKLTETARAAFRTKRKITREVEVAQGPETQQSTGGMSSVTGSFGGDGIPYSMESQATTATAASDRTVETASPEPKRPRVDVPDEMDI